MRMQHQMMENMKMQAEAFQQMRDQMLQEVRTNTINLQDEASDRDRPRKRNPSKTNSSAGSSWIGVDAASSAPSIASLMPGSLFEMAKTDPNAVPVPTSPSLGVNATLLDVSKTLTLSMATPGEQSDDDSLPDNLL